MIPIQDLLHRIQWDPEFGEAEFEIGYYDRVTSRIVHVPFRHVRFEKGERFAFEAVEDDGSVHGVPLHRVRAATRSRGPACGDATVEARVARASWRAFARSGVAPAA